MAADAGSLRIDVRWRAGAIAAVAVESTRPQPARLLVGRTPAEALGLLTTLYAICGRAQRACGEAALATALADPLSPARRETLLGGMAREAVQEHLWRLMLDWPLALGVPGAPDRFAHWYRRCAAPGAQWATELRAALVRDWLADSPERLESWARLPVFDAWVATGDCLLADLFRALRGAADDAGRVDARVAGETGPCLQHAAHPWLVALATSGRALEARVAARVVALFALLEMHAGGDDVAGAPDAALDFDAESPAPGRGTALASTARGLLVHALTVADGRIAAYSIATPTDCNFAADGPYVAHLRGARASSTAAAVRRAELWALALDPCVPYAVRAVPEHADA